jgi:4-hydroxy-tetrahydrodipicolinate synthase
MGLLTLKLHKVRKEAMNLNPLRGVIPAIPTPLLQNEDVDTDGLRRLLDLAVTEGAAAVFVLGSMGEGTALIDDQKLVVAQTTVRHINSAIPVLASISEVSTRRTQQMALRLQDLGVDFLVSTGPFFYRFPDSCSILDFWGTLCVSVSTPLVFYHQPGFTGNSYDIDTIDKILNLSGVVALKDSSCNFSLVAELLRRYPDKNTRPFSLLQGDESIFDFTLLMGGDGIVSGGGVLFIRTLVELYNAAIAGNRTVSYQLQRQFKNDLMNVLGPYPATDWMAAVKTQLKARGICNNIVTGPFLNRFVSKEPACLVPHALPPDPRFLRG